MGSSTTPCSSSILSAWPESEKLRIALNNSSAEGIKVNYTLPGIKYEFATPYNDGVNVSMDEQGLLTLINNGSFRDALYMTSKLLCNIGQGIGMNLNSTQISSMVPYSLRLVHAEAAFFSSNPNHSILRVHKLETDTQSVVEMMEKEHPNTPELAIWQERLHTVKALRARLLFKLKEFGKSMAEYERLLNESKTMEKQQEILANLLRIAMHVGDEKQADKYLEQLGTFCGRESSEYLMHCSFKSVFNGDYTQALAILQQLKALRPKIASDPVFANNEAICLLYSGRALESLQMLFNHPGPIGEPLAANLSTVSDLVSTNSQALKQNYLAKHAQERNELFDAQVMRIN